MAEVVIPVDADRMLFAQDLVNYVFRDISDVHVHHKASEFRERIHEAFNRTLEDAVDFLQELLELEIDTVYDRLKRENPINEEAYVRYAEKKIEKSFPIGFDAKIFLNLSVHLAMMAEKFYSDGTEDAPILAARFIRRCLKDANMMDGGWSRLDFIAGNMRGAAFALPKPSPKSNVEQHIPNPEPRNARPENFSRNDDLGREGINELRVQAVRGNKRDLVNSDSPSKAVPLENVNKSDSKFARMFSNQKTPLKESQWEYDVKVFYGSSGNGQFSSRSSSEKEVPLEDASVSGGNVNEPALIVPPLGSRDNDGMSANRSSSDEEVLLGNDAKQSDLESLPENIGDNRMVVNPEIGKEVILPGKANESDLSGSSERSLEAVEEAGSGKSRRKQWKKPRGSS